MAKEKAVDLMSKLIVEMVREYRSVIQNKDLEINHKNYDIDDLKEDLKIEQNKREVAYKQSIKLKETLDEVSKIIASGTEHNENDGAITIYLSSRSSSGERIISRLFALLDIPMTAEQIKDGDIDED